MASPVSEPSKPAFNSPMLRVGRRHARSARGRTSSAGGDSGADPVEALRGYEAVVVKVEPLRASLHACVHPRLEAFRASDLAVEQPEARAKELVRTERRPPLPDDGRGFLRPERVNAKNGAVADLADRLEIATAEPAFGKIDEDDAA